MVLFENLDVMQLNMLLFRVVLHDDTVSSGLERFGDDGFADDFVDGIFDTTAAVGFVDTAAAAVDGDFVDGFFDTTSAAVGFRATATTVDDFVDTTATTYPDGGGGDCEVVDATSSAGGDGGGGCEVDATAAADAT